MLSPVFTACSVTHLKTCPTPVTTTTGADARTETTSTVPPASPLQCKLQAACYLHITNIRHKPHSQNLENRKSWNLRTSTFRIFRTAERKFFPTQPHYFSSIPSILQLVISITQPQCKRRNSSVRPGTTCQTT
jgi:hypothetical protein